MSNIVNGTSDVIRRLRDEFSIEYNIQYHVYHNNGEEYIGRLNLDLDDSITWLKREIESLHNSFVDINHSAPIDIGYKLTELQELLENHLQRHNIKNDSESKKFVADELEHIIRRLRNEL